MTDALAPLRHREFRLLIGGRVVSFAGSAIASIALAFGVLELGGSAGDLGLVLTLSILPQVFFLLAGGVITDRLPRSRTRRRPPSGRPAHARARANLPLRLRRVQSTAA